MGETIFKLLLILTVLSLIIFGFNKIVEKSSADFNESQYVVAN